MEIPGNPNKMSHFSKGLFFIPPWNFQGGYTILRYFPGGMSMKYGKFQGIYINNKMFGNSRGPKQNVTFQGAFLHFFPWNFQGGYAIQRCFPWGYDNESLEIPEGGGGGGGGM